LPVGILVKFYFGTKPQNYGQTLKRHVPRTILTLIFLILLGYSRLNVIFKGIVLIFKRFDAELRQVCFPKKVALKLV